MINQQHNGPEPDEGAKVSPADQAGEDDGSTSVEGKDGHLHEDQKPLSPCVVPSPNAFSA